MSTARGRTPVWGRIEPGARRPRFTREQIAKTALEIADREGFEAVSMRRIADALKAGTMSLYHYVETKDELIALMDDALMGEALVTERELRGGWTRALAAIARSTRRALLRHPWALLSLQKAQIGPNAMRHFEQSLAAVADLPGTAATKLDLIALVDAYVFGAVRMAGEVHDRAREGKLDQQATDAAIDFGLAQVRSGQFPHIVAMFGDADPRLSKKAPKVRMWDPAGLDAQFERGLRMLLDGVAVQVGAGRAKTRKGRKR